ncbi:MAG: LuxR family transcriptional regulator [Hyphomicrobiales bacterium]|nr:LuxR family transcriptional regulator [Hyphomicrobiales bacterium]
MSAPSHPFSELDLAIKDVLAALNLKDVENALRIVTSGETVGGLAFQWWRHSPMLRSPDWTLNSPEASANLAVALATDGDFWATLAPLSWPGAAEGGFVVAVPVLGPRRSFGASTAQLRIHPDTWHADRNGWLGRLLLLATAVQERVERWSTDRNAVRLAPREIECLSLAAAGLKAKQIAEELGIGQQTVQFHLARARIKLTAGNTVQAVVRATQLGILRTVVPSQ